MPVVVDRNICPHNHKCPLVNLCPVEAISQNGSDYPQFDAEKCIECGICIDNCPKEAVGIHPFVTPH